ncbi:MAG: CDP-alcohol phosphatidyltransferase family protein [Anaerolineae bacterium]|nr:CDP-alcohol phosphatidyltransferase family protein [Anaerolineae bacterium]
MTIETQTTSPVTLSDRMRKLTAGVVKPIAELLHKLGVNPDFITLLGLILAAIAAYFITDDQLLIAAVLLLLSLPLDALDGAVARMLPGPRPFGAFLDSTLDRYADGALFAAIVVYGVRKDDDLIVTLALFALIGAYLVSYTRARAEGLGFECKIGLFSRMERTVALLALLAVGEFWGDAVTIGLIILAFGTQFTALQRFWHVWNLCQAQKVEQQEESH